MSKFSLRGIVVNLPLLLIALLLSMGANAGCYTNQEGTSQLVNTIQQPAFIVQRDAPVGSVIGTVAVPMTGKGALYCQTGSYYSEMKLFTTQSSIAGYYNTNVAGVGLKINGFTYPARQVTEERTLVLNDTTQRTLTLVKTGAITSGVINSGVLAIIYGDGDNLAAVTYILTGSTVTQAACSINTPVIQVPLDDVYGSDLTSVGTVLKPKTFNLGLNCDAGARINVKMTGAQNTDTSTAGVLQLTNAGSAGVATGVGVQILYNNEPLALNNNIVLKTSDGGQETFPFVAQYYQTKNPVTTGAANATMTLNLTYQ